MMHRCFGFVEQFFDICNHHVSRFPTFIAVIMRHMMIGVERTVKCPVLGIYCAVAAFHPVKAALERSGLELVGADLAYVPKQHCAVSDPDVAKRVLELFDAFDDHDDVQAVYSNEQFSDEVANKLAADA